YRVPHLRSALHNMTEAEQTAFDGKSGDIPLLPIALIVMNGERSRTDDAHIATQDAIELRQLVEVKLFDEAADIRSALRRPFCRECVPIAAFRTLLVDVLSLDQTDLVLREYLARTDSVVTENQRTSILRDDPPFDHVRDLEQQ